MEQARPLGNRGFATSSRQSTLHRERAEKDKDDIRAILAQTKVIKQKIIQGSKKQDTETVLQELLES